MEGFISKLSPKEKKILYFAIAFVVLAAVDRLYLGPIIEKINFTNEQIKQQEFNIRNDMRFLAHKGKIEKDYKEYGKYFVEKLPDNDVINAEFLSTVEQLATKSNVTLIKSNPADTQKDKEYVKYYANLDCSGELKNIIEFMYMLNSTEDLLKVVDFTMAPKRGSEGEVNASMTIVKLMMGANIAN